MSTCPYTAGDVVRHTRRPEWGSGSIQRVELLQSGGRNDQRLWIRFPNAGLKTLLASVAELERIQLVDEASVDGATFAGDETLVAREMNGETGWLASISKRKPEEAMSAIPAQASDPFLPAKRRLEFVLSLYRFDSTQRLVDWAVAQSGLGDPLSRFTRQDLEEFFRVWAFERDAQLARLLHDPELRGSPAAVKELVEAALPAAQIAARRAATMR